MTCRDEDLEPKTGAVCMYVCKDSAALAHARTRAHRPAAPRQSSSVSQTPHPTACPQAGKKGLLGRVVDAVKCGFRRGAVNPRLCRAYGVRGSG